MDKQAVLEQIREEAFRDEMEKISNRKKFIVDLLKSPRSHAERGLMKALNNSPPKVLSKVDKLTRAIKSIDDRKISIVEDISINANYKDHLNRELERAIEKQRMFGGSTWFKNKLLERKERPIVNALTREQKRLSKLSPGQIQREKFRMKQLQELKSEIRPTERQARINSLKKKMNNGGYW